MFSLDFVSEKDLAMLPALGQPLKTVVEYDNNDDFINHAVAIDQFPAEDFNLNDAGWPRNVISEHEQAQK